MEFEGGLDYFSKKFINSIKTDDGILRDLGLRTAQVEQYVKSTDKLDVQYFKIYNKGTRSYDVYKKDGNSYSIQKLRNGENEINKYMIDDFLTSEIDILEENKIKNINSYVNKSCGKNPFGNYGGGDPAICRHRIFRNHR